MTGNTREVVQQSATVCARPAALLQPRRDHGIAGTSPPVANNHRRGYPGFHVGCFRGRLLPVNSRLVATASRCLFRVLVTLKGRRDDPSREFPGVRGIAGG